MKKIFLLILLMFICLYGCAIVTPQQKQAWNETIPVCYTKADCAAKWAAARNWVQNNAGYKIQIYAEDLIETYNPTRNDPKIAVSVTKNPAGTSPKGDQIYSIRIRVWCDNIFGCIPTHDEAIINFNKYVSSTQANDENCYISMLNENEPKVGLYTFHSNTNKIIIKSVCFNSPAFKAGLKPNDVISKIGNSVISNYQDTQSAFNKISFGDTFTIEILRDNIPYSYHVKLPTKDEVNLLMASTKNKETTVVKQNIEEKLESLQRMLKKGLISQEEFDSKRKKLLNEI